MKRFFSPILLISAFVLACVAPAWPHCQVPCGIYDDQLRFDMIKEDTATIEKAMMELMAMGNEGQKNYNQMVRWVTTKEDHADHIMATVSGYFLAQRIALPKTPADQQRYEKSLTLLHQMLVLAMKTKQGLDTVSLEKLKALTAEFHTHYFDRK